MLEIALSIIASILSIVAAIIAFKSKREVETCANSTRETSLLQAVTATLR